MSSKIYLESISYDQNEEKPKFKSNTPYKSHRKTTSALVRNADAALYDITNSPPQSTSKYSTPLSPQTPKLSSPKQSVSTKSTPLKSTNTSNNTSNHISFLDGTSLVSKNPFTPLSTQPLLININL
ncbi:hypothetical protein RB653_000791 [Dictyostelium firmibasis]|uniref:Uncharacterized protein n=1 Tax=Dictyostelium firmibasis TaxID=79012 RepID=A0AAN7U2V5_9MYCE